MANQGYLIVPLVALSMVVLGIAGIFGQVFTLHKDTKRVGFIWIVAAVSNILANFILVPIMGIIGAAVATLASYLEALLLILIIGRRYSSDFPGFPWLFTAKSVISSLGMICCVYLIQSQVDDSLLINLVILILSGAAAYFILIRVIRALDVEEIEFVKKLLFGKA
jgi:O-antigen/teichoic acid export membrane protein